MTAREQETTIMAVIINDGKVSFVDYSLDMREAMMDEVMEALSYLGESFARDSFLDAVDERSEELGEDIRSLNWEDLDEVADSVSDNAGEPLLDALFELAVISFHEGDMEDWDGVLYDTLNQVEAV